MSGNLAKNIFVSISKYIKTRNWPAVTAKPEIITVFALAYCSIGHEKIRPQTTPR